MIRDKVIGSFDAIADIIKIDQSRCLRMRFNRSTCKKCFVCCNANAININNGLTINRKACSECMLCVSECPSGALQIDNLNFFSAIAKLREICQPVLSCNIRPGLQSHVKVFCLGFLSEEHIIALSVFTKEPLQINLTQCGDCRNGFIMDVFKKRLNAVSAKTSINIYEKIMPVEATTDLHYQDISYDRRRFFRAVKNFTIQKAVGLLDDTTRNECVSAYSVKKLPPKNEVLNKMLPVVTDEIYRDLIRNYYYNISANESCNDCFACVGMCPTGALKILTKESPPELSFNTSLCIGCGLCEDFCINNAICIEQGFSGLSPFEFYSVKEGLFCR